jgi:hypothetical protein
MFGSFDIKDFSKSTPVPETFETEKIGHIVLLGI